MLTYPQWTKWFCSFKVQSNSANQIKILVICYTTACMDLIFNHAPCTKWFCSLKVQYNSALWNKMLVIYAKLVIWYSTAATFFAMFTHPQWVMVLSTLGPLFSDLYGQLIYS